MSDQMATEAEFGHGLADTRASSRRPPLYGQYFGLEEAPFDLTPNPRFLFLTPRQREALSNLQYALTSSKGFTVVVGEAGTGKTTLVRAALGAIADSGSRYVVINNPTLGRQEFYEFLARELRLSARAASSKAQFLEELQRDVEARAAVGGLTGLIVDEAQSIPRELLEEIRLLGNIETNTTKLLNIVLCGQPELADRLNEPSLRQLKQRVALRCELGPLSLGETASYMSGRLRIAGGSPSETFTRDAVVAVFQGSHGIPRTINVICDNALIGGFAAQQKPVSADIVEDVCRDFDLTPGDAKSAAPPERRAMAQGPDRSPAAGVHGEGAPEGERPVVATLAPRSKRRFTFF